MLQGLHLFSEVSGLQVGKAKSALYCHGVNEHDANRIAQFSGFVRGSLPFKYLGVPISGRRIKAFDYELLADKMIAKIHV